MIRSPHPVPSPVRIRYHRPSVGETVYRQTLVHDDNRVLVTLARALDFPTPLVIRGRVALERGSDAVWFTFPGAWHDIGRFHLADGTFTGIYANLITPCTFAPGGEWETTDLFLDLWLPADGAPPTLEDEEEFAAAATAGTLPRRWAHLARREAERLMALARKGEWPPPVVREWTRERAIEVLAGR